MWFKTNMDELKKVFDKIGIPYYEEEFKDEDDNYVVEKALRVQDSTSDYSSVYFCFTPSGEFSEVSF